MERGCQPSLLKRGNFFFTGVELARSKNLINLLHWRVYGAVSLLFIPMSLRNFCCSLCSTVELHPVVRDYHVRDPESCDYAFSNVSAVAVRKGTSFFPLKTDRSASKAPGFHAWILGVDQHSLQMTKFVSSFLQPLGSGSV